MSKTLFALLVLLSNNAMACISVSENDGVQTLNIGAIYLDNNTNTADNITHTSIRTSKQVGYRKFNFCTTTGSSHWFVPTEAAPSEVLDGWSLYETSYEGVFYAMQAADSHSPSTWKSTTTNRIFLRNHDANGGYYLFSARSKIVLKGKINLDPGTYWINETIGKGVLSNSKTALWPVGYGGEVTINITARVIVTAPTCDINAEDKDQTVIMPETHNSKFSGVGSTVGSKDFQIRLNCEAGVALHAYKTDSNSTENTSQILTLNSGSTASGVGLQLFANNSTTPLSFGLSNSWNIGGPASSTQKDYTIPFMAKYIQTEPTITGGRVEAQSVISFLYQ